MCRCFPITSCLWSAFVTISIIQPGSLLYANTTSSLLVISKQAPLEPLTGPGTGPAIAQLKPGTIVIGLQHLDLISSPGRDTWQVMMINPAKTRGLVPSACVTPFKTWASALKAQSSSFISHRDIQSDSIPAAISLTNDPHLLRLWDDIQIPFEENKAEPEDKRLPDPYFARAAIWNRAGDHASAIADYLEGIRYIRNTNKNILAYEQQFKGLTQATDQLRVRPVPPLGTDDPSIFMAFQHFGIGSRYYLSGNYSMAIRSLGDAIYLNAAEPIYWYYRAISHYQKGDRDKAQYDALMGAYFEKRLSRSRRRDINNALLRVQGPARIWLEEFRLGSPTNHILRALNN